MKKLLLAIFLFTIIQILPAQPLVFCPPGSEWHYLFDNFWYPDTNEEVKYIKDSIIGQDTLKVLKHKWHKYYLRDNLSSGSNGLTLIKQKGDTIFFKNFLTPGGWQILYNFAAQPGDNWQTTVITNGPYGSSLPITYNYTVNAVSSINVNMFSLRTLSVTYGYTMQHWPNPNLLTFYGTTQFIERFGGSEFLFNFINQKWASDGDLFKSFLCYQDTEFGIKQFTTTDCRFNLDVGLEEYSAGQFLRLFPNPAHDKVTIEIEGAGANLAFRLADVSGRELKHQLLETGQSAHTIDLSDLAHGVYLVSVFRDKSWIYTGKLVKQD